MLVYMACCFIAKHAQLHAISVLKSGFILLQALCDLQYLKVRPLGPRWPAPAGKCQGQ